MSDIRNATIYETVVQSDLSNSKRLGENVNGFYYINNNSRDEILCIR